MSKIEDIVSKIIEIGDAITTLGTDSEFSKVAKTANMDFYKFRNEIVGLVRHGVRTGFASPATCGMEIKKTEEEDVYTVAIDAYFLIEGDKLQKISKQYTIFGFSYLPDSVRNMLNEKGLAKITFGAEEIQDIVVNMEKDVYDSRNRPLSHWINRAIKEFSGKGKYRVKLDDMVLYYRARLYSLSDKDEEQYLTDFMAAHLVDLDKLVNASDIDARKHGNAIYFDLSID